MHLLAICCTDKPHINIWTNQPYILVIQEALKQISTSQNMMDKWDWD